MTQIRTHVSVRTAGLTLVIGGLLMITLLRHVSYNATPSAPVGWYWYTPLPTDAPLATGQLVRMTPPDRVRQALHRVAPQLDVHRPWMKTIVAVAGETVCLDDEHVRINGAWRAPRPLLQAYALPSLHGCIVLTPGTYFVMNAHPRSFDSRYIGAIPRSLIHGTLTPLWTWEDQ